MRIEIEKTAEDPGALRLAAGTAVILVLASPWIVVGRWNSGADATALSIFLSVVSGSAFMLLTGALAEWAVHRYVMHRPSRLPLLRLVYHLHHRAHHWVHFPPNAYVQTGPIEYPSIRSATTYEVCGTVGARLVAVAAYALFYSSFAFPILIAGWLLTSNPWFAASVGATAATLVFLFIRVHDAVHFPGASRLERFRWFWFMDRHHYVHHVDTASNTNLVLPLGDWLMGTLRLNLTRAEEQRWPTYEQARSIESLCLVRSD
jgi:hypothetical protein